MMILFLDLEFQRIRLKVNIYQTYRRLNPLLLNKLVAEYNDQKDNNNSKKQK